MVEQTNHKLGTAYTRDNWTGILYPNDIWDIYTDAPYQLLLSHKGEWGGPRWVAVTRTNPSKIEWNPDKWLYIVRQLESAGVNPYGPDGHGIMGLAQHRPTVPGGFEFKREAPVPYELASINMGRFARLVPQDLEHSFVLSDN